VIGVVVRIGHKGRDLEGWKDWKDGRIGRIGRKVKNDAGEV
jgi:hypothetical protein